ncbi:MAG: hypothetical protein V1888_01045 [archaeon]
MRKVSIVGIDCTGKTSVVESLGDIYGASTIHLTKYKNNVSDIARISGGMVDKLARFGERRNSKIATGAAYFLHLAPYWIEENAKKDSNLLISDRDPIIDAICYSNFYLPTFISKKVGPTLKSFLESYFNYPDAFIYLDVSPEVSVRRNSGDVQLHEKVGTLSRLKELFDEQLSSAKKKGIKIDTINTDFKSLDGVIDEARFLLR